MNTAGVIITLLVGIILGILTGAIWSILKIKSAEKRAMKDYQKEKGVFEVKDYPDQKVSSKAKEKQNQAQQIIPLENPKEWKENLKHFQQVNKVLAKLNEKYEDGDMTHEQLQKEYSVRKDTIYMKVYDKLKREGKI